MDGGLQEGGRSLPHFFVCVCVSARASALVCVDLSLSPSPLSPSLPPPPSPLGIQEIKTALDYTRGLSCWGWGDFGQLDPPPIDHVTMLSAGARHTCATNRQRLAVCWGSNLYGQGDLPRPTANMSRVYCKFGDYIDDLSSRVKYKCEDKV